MNISIDTPFCSLILYYIISSYLQTWADAFKGVPELKEVEKQYYDLKKKGIEFPMTDLDKMAPIHTPARVSMESDLAIGKSSIIESQEYRMYCIFIHFRYSFELRL